MNYEEINELNRQTAELTKRIALKWGIIDVVLAVFCLVMIALAVKLIWSEYRERKERKSQEVFCWDEFVPVVTDTVQYVNGVEFHKMGTVERR